MIIDERERGRDSAPRVLRNKIKTEINKVASAIGGTPISTIIETISVSDFVWRREDTCEILGVMVGRKAIRDIRSHFLQSALFSFALNSISGAFLAMVSHQSNFITLPVRLRYDIRAYLEPRELKAHGTISKEEHGAIACIFSEPVKDRCAFCSSPARKRCGKCFTAFYCSEHHQSGHWKVHRISCCVYQEQRKPIVFPPKRL